MTEPRIQIVSRMRGIKEDIQEQLEIGLANAIGTVREKRSSVAQTETMRRALAQEQAGKLYAAELQYRAAYQDMLKQQLEQQMEELEAAESIAVEHKVRVKQAYIETNQWVQLEETQKERLQQERDHKSQVEADDLAVQRYFSQVKGSF